MATAKQPPVKKPVTKAVSKPVAESSSPSAPPSADDIAATRRAMADAHAAVVTAQNALRRARSLRATSSDLPHSVEEAEENLAEARRLALDSTYAYQHLVREAAR